MCIRDRASRQGRSTPAVNPRTTRKWNYSTRYQIVTHMLSDGWKRHINLTLVRLHVTDRQFRFFVWGGLPPALRTSNAESPNYFNLRGLLCQYWQGCTQHPRDRYV
eukprot:1824342-Pyramimonas_sp.AAC.1